MASSESKDFIERAEVREALDELFDECADKHGDSGDQLPDAAAFLRERGVEPPVDGPIQVQVSVAEEAPEPAAAQPTVFICGENEDKWAYRKCEFKNGKEVCRWVCV